VHVGGPFAGGQAGGISWSPHEPQDVGDFAVPLDCPQELGSPAGQPADVVSAADPRGGGAGRDRHQHQAWPGPPHAEIATPEEVEHCPAKSAAEHVGEIAATPLLVRQDRRPRSTLVPACHRQRWQARRRWVWQVGEGIADRAQAGCTHGPGDGVAGGAAGREQEVEENGVHASTVQPRRAGWKRRSQICG
jgi:hypothetical protein